MTPEKYLALKTFEHLKWHRDRKVFLGDDEDAERCKRLERKNIGLYAPSAWHQRFPDGYIRFGNNSGWRGGRLFDLRHRTINGTPTYIFEYSEEIDLLCRRLKALNQTREHARLHQGDDLRAYWELVVPKVYPQRPLRGGEDWLRRQISEVLPVLGLEDLEALVDAAKASIETGGVMLPLLAICPA